MSISSHTYATTQLIILGDSLSASYGMQQQQGWVYLLQNKLKAQYPYIEIINASISGETTAGGLARLPQLLQEKKPEWLLIELGGNDGLRGFPVAKIKQNLQQIIQLAKEQKIKIALIQIAIPPNYGRRYTQQFHQIYTEVAIEANIPLLPFFMVDIVTNTHYMQADGIHPNHSAQPVIRDFMYEQFLKLSIIKL